MLAILSTTLWIERNHYTCCQPKHVIIAWDVMHWCCPLNSRQFLKWTNEVNDTKAKVSKKQMEKLCVRKLHSNKNDKPCKNGSLTGLELNEWSTNPTLTKYTNIHRKG
jgi:hypothetical protein